MVKAKDEQIEALKWLVGEKQDALNELATFDPVAPKPGMGWRNLKRKVLRALALTVKEYPGGEKDGNQKSG
jgi:hypothetical protein